MKDRISATDMAISAAIVFMNSPKFTGIETVSGERKDWISTSDTIHILQSLRALLHNE